MPKSISEGSLAVGATKLGNHMVDGIANNYLSPVDYEMQLKSA